MTGGSMIGGSMTGGSMTGGSVLPPSFFSRHCRLNSQVLHQASYWSLAIFL